MEPQKGKCKQDPRPMCKAPPYCYLQITILLNSLLITLEEKIHSNSRCLLTKKSKKKKKIQDSGWGGHSHFDLWQGQVITNVHVQDLSTSQVLSFYKQTA